MRVPTWLFPLLVLAAFSGAVWTAREAGIWRDRARLAPPSELEPAPKTPAPGSLPM